MLAWELGVYSLRDGTVKEIEALGSNPNWMVAWWFTPSSMIVSYIGSILDVFLKDPLWMHAY
jgi:hypothetical protein